MDGIQVRILGIEDLTKAIDELTADMRKRVVLSALRAGAKPIVERARQLAPELQKPSPYRTRGLIKSRIGVFTSKIFKGQQGLLGVMVRVKQNKGRRVKGTSVRVKAMQQDPFYAKFLEVGTRSMAKRSFLQPAASQMFNQALEIISQRLKARIDRANRQAKT